MSNYENQPRINALYSEMEGLTQAQKNLDAGGAVIITIGQPPGSMVAVMGGAAISIAEPEPSLVAAITKVIRDRQTAIVAELEELGVEDVPPAAP